VFPPTILANLFSQADATIIISGARGAAVDDKNYVSLKVFSSQALSFKPGWFHSEHRRRRLQGKRPECHLRSGYGIEAPKLRSLRIQFWRDALSIKGKPQPEYGQACAQLITRSAPIPPPVFSAKRATLINPCQAS
jgi:hypothetical protein